MENTIIYSLLLYTVVIESQKSMDMVRLDQIMYILLLVICMISTTTNKSYVSFIIFNTIWTSVGAVSILIYWSVTSFHSL